MGRENHWKDMKKGRILLLLRERPMARKDLLEILEEQPPRLDQQRAEELLGELIKKEIVEFNGEVYKIAEKGVKGLRWFDGFRRLADDLIDNPEFASRVGTGSNSILAVLTVIVGFLSGSVAMISKGLDSGLDVLVSIAIWVGIRLRTERLSALLVSVMMTSSGLFLIYESSKRMFFPEPMELVVPAVVVAAIAIMINYFMMNYKHFVGKRTRTLSLVADAYHSRVDVLSSSGVLVGVVASLLGVHLLDPLVAVLVSFLIIRSGIGLVRESLGALGGQEVDWSRYKMGYEKGLQKGKEKMIEELVLEILTEKDLTAEEIISSLHESDPFLVLFNNERDEDRLLAFSKETAAKVLSKLEKEGTIGRKDDRFILIQ